MTTTLRDTTITLALVLFAGCRTAAPASETMPTQEVSPAAELVRAPAALRSAGLNSPAARPAVQRARRAATRADRRTAQRRPAVRRGAADAALRAKLETRIPSLRLESITRLHDAGVVLARASGVDVIVDSAAEEAFADGGGELDLLLEHPVRLRSALNLLTDTAGESVAWTVRYGAVFITSTERARGRPKTMVFDVRDLLWSPPHFAAPEMGVLASGMVRERPATPDRVPRLEGEMLLDAIRAAVAPGTWDQDGNSIEVVNGKLFVTHD